MPEILRSLIVVLLLATVVFYYTRKYANALGLKPEVIQPRINAWYTITCAAFLSHNFWLFCAIAAVVLLVVARKDPNPLALALFVLYAVPLFGEDIPGAGIVNYIFELNYFRIISLCVLLPLYWKQRKLKNTISFGKYWTDKFVFGYIVYSLILVFPSTTLTNFIRIAFLQFVDIFLPYYVASRCLQSLSDFDDAIQALLIGSAVAAAIGIVEFFKGWLLYSAMPNALGIAWAYGGYLLRGDDLRALASSGQAIVLGYLMAIALGLYWYLGERLRNQGIKSAIYLLLVAGLIAPVSRGPWIGAAVMVLLLIVMGESPIQKIAKLAALLLVPALIFLASPYGSKVLDYLPFVGTVDAQNVTFRQSLLENSIEVIRNNPWFGSPDFLNTEEMESLRAGGNGGIIDVVNSYIAIALSGGMVGLGLFAGYFIACVILVYSARRRLRMQHQYLLLGNTLLATQLGVMVIIYTVSSVLAIPILYWLLGGFCVAYGAMSLNMQTQPVKG